MRSGKNHIVSISFIFLLCFPALTFVYLQVNEKLLQHEMLEKLEQSQLETLTLHHTAVEWYKKEKEIIVHETLFDVHTYFSTGDSIIFTGLFDKKETELKAQVRRLLQRSQTDKETRELIIAKMITQLWVSDSTSMQIAAFKVISIKGYFFKSTALISTDIPKFTPPPERQSLL